MKENKPVMGRKHFCKNNTHLNTERKNHGK